MNLWREIKNEFFKAVVEVPRMYFAPLTPKYWLKIFNWLRGKR